MKMNNKWREIQTEEKDKHIIQNNPKILKIENKLVNK